MQRETSDARDQEDPVESAAEGLQQAIVDRLIKDGNAARAFDIAIQNSVVEEVMKIAGRDPREGDS
jgi:hypothetical protein